jgi:predicted amidophosphoribosyltransferase
MVSSIAALAFPARCPGCGVPAEPVCGACRSTARPAPQVAPPDGLAALFVPFAYEGVVRELVARAKYRDRHAALAWLASEMVATIDDSVGIDVVTWAPTTRSRRRTRGFDQAEVLARAIGSEVRRPVRAQLRREAGTPQTGSGRADRVVGPTFAPLRKTRAERTVLLVDDVVTTGATMRAAAAALAQGGISVVIGAAAARRP